MGFAAAWLVTSIIIGAIGVGRDIGFVRAFLLSIFLSPIIGLIVTAFSEKKAEEEYKQEVLTTQKQQQETLEKISGNIKPSSISEELGRLKDMKDNGTLTEEEFQKAKEKVLSV